MPTNPLFCPWLRKYAFGCLYDSTAMLVLTADADDGVVQSILDCSNNVCAGPAQQLQGSANDFMSDCGS